MDEEQVKKINNLLNSSTIDESSQSLMREFLNSLDGQPQVEKIVELLDRFPSLFENFSKCFKLKKEFLSEGKSESEWQDFLKEEKEILND